MDEADDKGDRGEGKPPGGDTLPISPGQCVRARELLDWSVPELARRAGVEVPAVRALEGGVRLPDAAALASIRRAFDKADGGVLGRARAVDDAARHLRAGRYGPRFAMKELRAVGYTFKEARRTIEDLAGRAAADAENAKAKKLVLSASYDPPLNSLARYAATGIPFRSGRMVDDVRREDVLVFRVAAARLSHRAGVDLETTTAWLLECCERGDFVLYDRPPPCEPAWPKAFPFGEGPDAVAKSPLLLLREEVDAAAPILRTVVLDAGPEPSVAAPCADQTPEPAPQQVVRVGSVPPVSAKLLPIAEEGLRLMAKGMTANAAAVELVEKALETGAVRELTNSDSARTSIGKAIRRLMKSRQLDDPKNHRINPTNPTDGLQ
jgi:transcriptional regulator with XRE-family HTH domain